MNIEIILGKLRYYLDWYAALSEKERSSFIGKWVAERFRIFMEIATEAKIPLTTYHGSQVGNYSSKLL